MVLKDKEWRKGWLYVKHWSLDTDWYNDCDICEILNLPILILKCLPTHIDSLVGEEDKKAAITLDITQKKINHV